VASLAVGAVVARWIVLLPARTRYRAAALAALLSFALLGLKILRDDLRFELFRREFLIHQIHPNRLEAAVIVDGTQTSHRIAVTSGPWQDLDNWVVYPFLGRALQNQVRYVPVSRDGAIHHFGLGSLNDEYVKTADLARWEARLREQAFTEVMSFRPRSIELTWMESHPTQFRRLAGEAGDWGLFAVLDP
jgi:hypothetical protein